jgi:hypothetical protein
MHGPVVKLPNGARGKAYNTHSTTGRAPGLHFESELAHLRPVPGDINAPRRLPPPRTPPRPQGRLRAAWTASFYEVPGDLVGERVELRFDPRCPDDLPLVFHHGVYRDVARPARPPRQRLRPPPGAARRRDLSPRTMDIDAIGLIQDEFYRTVYGASGGPDAIDIVVEDDDIDIDIDDDNDDGGAA